MKRIINELPDIRLIRRLINLRQGESEINMTKNDVNAIRMLKEGKFEDDVYCSSILPRVRYQLLKDGSISATQGDNVVFLSPKAQKLITQFRDANRPKIAWDMDFRKRYF